MGVFGIIWLACAVFGATIGAPRGRTHQGFWLGLFLGPVGVLVIAVVSRTPEAEAEFLAQVAAAGAAASGGLRECPYCAEPIKRAAIVCKHCRRDVEPLAPLPLGDMSIPNE